MAPVLLLRRQAVASEVNVAAAVDIRTLIST